MDYEIKTGMIAVANAWSIGTTLLIPDWSKVSTISAFEIVEKQARAAKESVTTNKRFIVGSFERRDRVEEFDLGVDPNAPIGLIPNVKSDESCLFSRAYDT